MKFSLGQVVITPNALEKLKSDDILNALNRHVAGDWGEMDPEDRLENDQALANGSRLFSAYRSDGTKFWIITEADRSSTCVLLPEDY